MAAAEKERLSFYDGAVQIDFYPNSHRYKLVSLDGVEKNEWLPSPSSVTGKLDKSGALMGWATGVFEATMLEHMRDGVNFTRDDVVAMLAISKNAYAQKRDEAADVGTVVHEFAEHGQVNQEAMEMLSDADKEKARNGVAAFQEWQTVMAPSIKQKEFRVFSRRHKYVGQCDGLAEIDGKTYIIDYKTSKGIYTSHLYQVAAYMKAYEEMTGNRVDGAKILNFAKADVYDKNNNLIREAGTFDSHTITRGQLVQAFKAFKGLLDVYRIDYPLSKTIN